MTTFNHFTFSPLLTAITTFSLGIFVLLKGRCGKTLYVIFALYSFSISLWSFCSTKFTPTFQDPTLFWSRFLHLGAILIPVFFVHFIYKFLEEKNRNILVLTYFISALFLIFNFFTLIFIKGVTNKASYSYPTPSTIYPLYVIFFITCTLFGIFKLFRASLKAKGNRRNQINYLLWSSIFGYLGGFKNFMILIGLEIFPIYPYGTYAIALYVLVVAYAILRHRLMDIEVVIKKTIIFGGLAAFALGAAFFSTSFVGRYIGGGNDLVSFAITAFIITLLFEPLRNGLVNITEKFLFQKEYDHQAILKEISRGMVGKVELEGLNAFISSALFEKMKLKNISIVDANDYAASPIINWHRHDKRLVLYDEIEYLSKKKKYNLAQLKDTMHQLKVALSIPIFLKNEIYWLMLLGDKKSDKPYTKEDINMIEALSHEISIAIENAINFQNLRQSQLELLRQENLKFVSVLVKGLAHEIFNPLTPLQHGIEDLEGENLLKIYEIYETNKDKLDKNEELKFKEAILALRESTKSLKTNARHIQLIVDTLNKIEKGDDKTIGPVDIKTFLKEVVTIIGLEVDPNLQQGVLINQNIERTLPPIKGNPTLLKQVFINLYKNACEAMKSSIVKTIDISCKINESSKKELLIEFFDTGPGILPEILPKLFTYGATTKGSKGSGIGLNQCKAIIEKFGGSIKVESEKNEGTKFIIGLPVWAEG